MGLAAAGERKFGPLYARHVPIIISVSDLVWCVGAGMTLVFFNLFFIQELKFTPMQVSLLATASPFAVAAVVKVTRPFTRVLGRAQTSFALILSSALLMLIMSGKLPVFMFVAIYLLRGGLANASRPIDKAILADFTPSSQRGRWGAVEAFSSVSWSGSAFLGGVLSDKYDYRYTFFITGCISLASCLVYLPLLALVPRHEADLLAPTEGGAARGPEPTNSATDSTADSPGPESTNSTADSAADLAA
eukprot:NODE_2756_length_881_cov_84.767554.p2 GENE.NODE_2756_length_881_cov_84.767554~~NODE_2756_length_881_cov_84.767554.p2  ORF type:complete len:247 (-),score=65.65 NODE_2756_length_881_cov_84.767554:123-863(-)